MASGSDSYSTNPDLSGLKHNIISGLFEGKCPSDYESAWSPTSPLDFMLLSSLGNPFGTSSSKSIRKGHLKSWDSGKVGLSIVDSLDDHLTDSSRILRSSLDSKSVIFGSWIRSINPKCQKPHLPKTPKENNDKSNVDLIKLDSSCLVNAHCLGAEDSTCHVLKQSPGSLNGHTESDIEISEDYTCIISHGPNPKTIHFYGDQVVESVEHNRVKKESIFVIAPLNLTTPIDELSSNDFMSFCCSCSKKLSMGKDIYMCRGDKPFCSNECRSELIQLDEEMEEKEDKEKAAMSSSSSDKDGDGVIFTVG